MAYLENTFDTGAELWPCPRLYCASIQSTPWQKASTWSPTPLRGEKASCSSMSDAALRTERTWPASTNSATA